MPSRWTVAVERPASPKVRKKPITVVTIATNPKPERPHRRVRPRGDARAVGVGSLAVQINCRATRGPG